MPLTLKQKKGLLIFNAGGVAIGGACCGLSFIPWTQKSAEIDSQNVTRKFWYPRFVFGSADSKELFIETRDLQKYKGDNNEIPFDQITIRWGTRKLQAGDSLVNACVSKEKEYYLLQHIWNTEFRLYNGEKIYWDQFYRGDNNNCQLAKNSVKTINLDFKQTTLEGGAVNKKIIVVNNCRFQLNSAEAQKKEWKSINMICKLEPEWLLSAPSSNGGVTNGVVNNTQQKEVTLTGNYQENYIQTISLKK